MILWTNIGYFLTRNNQLVFIMETVFNVRQELEISKANQSNFNLQRLNDKGRAMYTKNMHLSKQDRERTLCLKQT